MTEFIPNQKTRLDGRVFAFNNQFKGFTRGFTTVELVVVMVLVGIMAAVAMPRFFGASKFHEMGHAEAISSALRIAQKTAIANGCDVRAEITPNNFFLWQRATSCAVGDFTRPLLRPGSGQWGADTPTGVAVSSLDIYFDGSGVPYLHVDGSLVNSTLSLSIGSRNIEIEAMTGFVH